MAFELIAVLIAGVAAVFVWAFHEKQQAAPQVAIVHERAARRAEEKGRKPAPITGVCSVCGKKETLPFRCKYCDQLFCREHRLPEDHKCDGVKIA